MPLPHNGEVVILLTLLYICFLAVRQNDMSVYKGYKYQNVSPIIYNLNTC